MERRGEQSISSSRKRCQTIKLSLEKIKVYARGWLNYYGIASMKNNIDDINGWLYHRIRMCIWKQWKKPRTKVRNLIKMGVPKDLAMQAGNTRRGHWFATHTVAVNMAMTKERLINSGFYDLATAYQSVHVNYWKRRIPNGTYGAVRGQRLATASYSIWYINTYCVVHSRTSESEFVWCPAISHCLFNLLGYQTDVHRAVQPA